MIENIGNTRGKSGLEWFNLSVMRRIDNLSKDCVFVVWSKGIKGNLEGIGCQEAVKFFSQFQDNQLYKIACRYNSGFYNAVFIAALLESNITAPKSKDTQPPREGEGTGGIPERYDAVIEPGSPRSYGEEKEPEAV